jgi:hypothetical protein
MRFKSLAVAAASLTLCGCYRVTVMTNATPSTIADYPWQHSFIGGLVPPPEITVKEKCPNGVQKVVTEHSFVNSIVGIVTQGIWTPMHVEVTCAAR